MAVKPNVRFRVVVQVYEVENNDGEEKLLTVAGSQCDVTVGLLEYARLCRGLPPGLSPTIDDVRSFHNGVLANLHHCGKQIIGWLGMRL